MRRPERTGGKEVTAQVSRGMPWRIEMADRAGLLSIRIHERKVAEKRGCAIEQPRNLSIPIDERKVAEQRGCAVQPPPDLSIRYHELKVGESRSYALQPVGLLSGGTEIDLFPVASTPCRCGTV